jgi:hypothetical protein
MMRTRAHEGPAAVWYIPLLLAAELLPPPSGAGRVTIDEELNVLDEQVRRLKIEYDVFFGGGSKKPPNDTEWRVQSLIKKFSDSSKLTFPQRFRYNSIVQRYALFSDLWRQKLKIKEEGYRRPQDALHAIQGMRTGEEKEAAKAMGAAADAGGAHPFKISCSDADVEAASVRSLFDAMIEARKQAGDANASGAAFDSFKAFVKKKTEQIRKDYGCSSVEYSVELEGGQVRLKAKAKI